MISILRDATSGRLSQESSFVMRMLQCMLVWAGVVPSLQFMLMTLPLAFSMPFDPRQAMPEVWGCSHELQILMAPMPDTESSLTGSATQSADCIPKVVYASPAITGWLLSSRVVW